MRTLRITLLASLAGWLAGIVAGSVGGFVMVLAEHGLAAALHVLTVFRFVVTEVRWAVFVGVAILPGSLFFVAPLVFRALGRSSFWHPLWAACVGGGLGIVGFVLWLLVASLFTAPVNWSRRDDVLATTLLYPGVARVIGATTGCVAVLTARSYARTMPVAAPAAHDLPPPVPYEY